MSQTNSQNIVIAGYPKSGTTWLVRLVAELLKCPVYGEWNYNLTTFATEGLDKNSSFKCYKSHQKASVLLKDNRIQKILFIVRNPLDIVISGANFFNFNKLNVLYRLVRKFKAARYLYNKVYTPNKSNRQSLMIDALLNGSDHIEWLHCNWQNYTEDMLATNVFYVTYESLHQNPLATYKKISLFLNLDLSENEIKTVVENQSFSKKKEAFKKEGELEKLNHMRVGKTNQWPSVLSKKQTNQILNNLNETMYKFSYTDI